MVVNSSTFIPLEPPVVRRVKSSDRWAQSALEKQRQKFHLERVAHAGEVQCLKHFLVF